MVLADEHALLAKVVVEQIILFTVTAWDANCPQHIPQRFEASDVLAALALRDARIEAMEAELTALRTLLPSTARARMIAFQSHSISGQWSETSGS